MYRVDRNNFYRRQKTATIYTPAALSHFIYGLIGGQLDKKKTVLDPCVGNGSLLKPFEQAGFTVHGIDIEKQGYPHTQQANYLNIHHRREINMRPTMPAAVVMNPPFNIDDKTKADVRAQYGGRPLLPEIWLQKAIALFGKDVPMLLFTPYGLRLNQTAQSKRWQKFVRGEYPEINSIISLPKDVFDGILFHSEILIFNIDHLKPHYFYTSSEQE